MRHTGATPAATFLIGIYKKGWLNNGNTNCNYWACCEFLQSMLQK